MHSKFRVFESGEQKSLTNI